MELTLKRTLPKDADAVVVGLARCDGRTRLTGWPPDRDKAFAKRAGQSLLSAAEVVGATPKRGEVRQLPDGRQRVVVVGLGDGALEPGPVRQAVATAVRAVGGTEDHPVRHVAVSLGLDGPEFVKAIAEGALLGAYRYQPISAKTPPVGLERLTLIGPADAAAKRACDLARATARAVVRARDLVNRPPNLLAPADLAAKAEEWALAAGAKCEVLDERALEEQGFGGLVAVGSGSARPPRLVKVTWAPRGAQTHVALVGKGITFDSGGLDIKPAPSMVTMGGDMSGAADCLAAAVAAAELKLKVRVTAWLCCAENMPSGTAYRPSDVLTIRGGTTVENYNTDAEGRLVLADGLARAAEDGPDLIVDVATLTGAKMIALGQTTNAVFASDDTVADQLIDAAEAAGESFWHLPITDEAEESLRSKVADVKSGGKREGGALVAAAFLRRFTAGAPWAHLDIAGSNFNEGEPKGVLASGATGVGVPTLVALLTSLAA